MRIKGCLLLAAVSAITLAQTAATFKARLAPVPLDLAMFDTISGSGQASATITGTRLNVSGTFDGLKSPATVAHIHRGSVTGVRGPAVFDLTIDPAASGKLSGSFDLNAEQMESLRKGRLYIQIHSEKAPDGNLWGWLLP